MIRFDAGKLSSGETEEVRVAINASILQRVCGNGCYFLDDLPVLRLAIEEERLLLPSIQEALLQKSQENNEDENHCENYLFGHLWIKFCAKLSEMRTTNVQRSRSRYCILGVVWLVISSFFLNTMLRGELECAGMIWLCTLGIILGVFFSVPAEVFLDGEEQIQQLVDEMTMLLEKEGYDVDYVHDRRPLFPNLVYVRFKKSSSSSGGGSRSPLSETMRQFQRKALEEHEEIWIAKHQSALRKSTEAPRCCGIKVESIASYEGAIKVVVAVLGFLICCIFLVLVSFPTFY